MTKGMPRLETTGPAQAEISAGIQILAERLAVLLAYPYVQLTECLDRTQYPSAEKLSPLYNRCHKDIFLTRQTFAASS
ncbi:hypothetical protein V6N12_036804 [Hibiscus sabdariffa]|uniref:Uncharacterized protein n=1 Tax=Hibiscus sabdariffa TaxID=183260 RepID=A0ABR2BUZ9_9ROSI